MKNGVRIQMKVVGCVWLEDFVSADYCFLWHVDTIMRFQWDFSSTEDFKIYCLQIENGNFDQSVELAKVRNIFGTITKNKFWAFSTVAMAHHVTLAHRDFAFQTW
jgi:hypothetical protein